jgi:hypothetical protein
LPGNSRRSRRAWRAKNNKQPRQMRPVLITISFPAFRPLCLAIEGLWCEREYTIAEIPHMPNGSFRPTCLRVLSGPTGGRKLYYVRWDSKSFHGRIISRETLKNARLASFLSRIPTRGGSFLRFWHDRISRSPE